MGEAVQQPARIRHRIQQRVARGDCVEGHAVAENADLHLPAHGVDHAFLGMADVAYHRTAGVVEMAPAIHIPHVAAAGLVQHRAVPA